MKVENSIIAALFAGVLAFSCDNRESKSLAVEVNKEPSEETENPGTVLNEDEVTEFDNKVYAVEEFVGTYETDNKFIKNNLVTVEGYYMNHNKQKANNTDEKYEYNVTLYKDDAFGKEDEQVFIKMKSNDATEFKGIKQGDKIAVKGIISGEEFFGAPVLIEGEILK